MRRLLYTAILLILAFFAQMTEAQEYISIAERHLNDIMARVRENALEVSSQYPDYEAGIYMQGNVDILKRGPFLKQIPYLKKLQKGVDSYQAEFIGEITFTNPNIYNKSVYSISSDKKKFMEGHVETVVQPLMKLNVYSQYLFSNIYSPFAYKSYRYYRYSIVNFWQRGDDTYFRISFKPKFSSYKFIEGDFVVTSRNWNIRELSFKGSMELINFNIDVVMEEEGTPAEILPHNIRIDTEAKILGTRLKGSYMAALRYDSVMVSHLIADNAAGREKYNLSSLYRTDADTLQAIASSIRRFRDSSSSTADNPVAGVVQDTLNNLSGRGDTLTGGQLPADSLLLRLDTLASLEKERRGALARMGNFFISDYTLDIKNVGELDIQPLVSPILFDFSTSNGISYTQKLKFTRVTRKEKLFYLEPRVGYNFKYKEFYWGVKGEINYATRKMSRIFVDIGNGSKITTERIREDLFSLPMPIYDSIGLNLRDFKTGYARLGHKIEIANGLTLGTNVAFMRYSENGYSDFTLKYPDSQFVSQAQKIASHRYITFVPELELTYTPHQYYYMNGERKTYLYSRYPTFNLSLAHAIKGVFNSTTRYNKLEFDMQQRLAVGPMHEFFYRAGFGVFYDYSDLYFAEFKNLRRNRNDDIGGTFHLLPRFRYNEIDKYLRANIKYDAPMLLASSLLRGVKYITKERLYCNLLLVDTMDPYIEMGYGIGTHIFNVGVFWGGEVTRWNLVGVKFTFDIFN